jgi:hypothetical protein
VTNPAPAPPPPGSLGWRVPRWILIGAGQIAVIIAAIFGTLHLAGHRLQSDPGKTTSLEEQWNSTIARLGIEPVYPPQEDFAVGDVFVTVVADAAAQRNADVGPDPSSEIFIRRSVKLGHADVAKMLDDAYRALPYFPIAAAQAPATASPPSPAPAPNTTAAVSIFGSHSERAELPRAAFPGFTIADNGNAASGAAGGGGWFDFGASRAASEKLVLGVVETYGLDSVAGTTALNSFCSAEETQELCTEKGARKYLHFIAPARSINTWTPSPEHISMI